MVAVYSLAILFAITMFIVSLPLAVFRILPTGYLSAAGLLFAGLGAFRYLTG